MKALIGAFWLVLAYALATVLFPAHVSADLHATDWANLWTWLAILGAWMVVIAVVWSVAFVFAFVVAVVLAVRTERRIAAFRKRGLK
ncbi:hypothetical protein [Paenirhodobacter populi]|uniref:hypothetical protein n=1 Tax=Paenirhodobacter populi TaxID=2306993 RepID=UPI000FE356B6|nr:hypothetical protein [Sinirhodobacter populi]RWR09726.1 hypothetical protein D2T32_05115 [Sinirhodobacter populi]